MSYAEARNGPLAFYNDIFYANLGLAAVGVRSRDVHPQIGGTLSAALGLDFEEAVVEVGAAYEVARWSSGASSSTALDVLGGARYWHQEISINLNGAGANTVLSGETLNFCTTKRLHIVPHVTALAL